MNLICGTISSSRSLASSFAEAFAFTMWTLSSTSTETRPEKEEFTEEGHDVLLSLSLLKSFALEVYELPSKFMDLVTVLS